MRAHPETVPRNTDYSVVIVADVPGQFTTSLYARAHRDGASSTETTVAAALHFTRSLRARLLIRYARLGFGFGEPESLDHGVHRGGGLALAEFAILVGVGGIE